MCVYWESKANHGTLGHQRTVKICSPTFTSLHKGQRMICIMQAEDVCPLSSFCGHCYGRQPHERHLNHTGREEENERSSRSYLSICRKSLKALVGQGMLDGCVCNKRKAVINHCFRHFLSCEHQPKFIKRTLVKDRILIFNALQLHHTNQI